MHISSSFGQNSTFGVNSKLNTPTKPLDRSTESVVVAEVEQQQNSNKQAKESIVYDEQAVALFEQNQQSQVTQAPQSNESFSSDQPSAQNETAVASYQAINNLAQRESVQQLFGVDVFA